MSEVGRRAVLAALAALAAMAGPARAEDTLRIGSEAADKNPCRNVAAARAGSEGDPRLRTLVDTHHSDAVRQFILGYHQGRQHPAW